MREHRTAKMRKGISMKFLCIISGCPAGGEEMAHFFFFSMGLHRKKGALARCNGKVSPDGRQEMGICPYSMWCSTSACTENSDAA